MSEFTSEKLDIRKPVVFLEEMAFYNKVKPFLEFTLQYLCMLKKMA